MAGTKLVCPNCKAILKSSKALPVGKRVTCVQCKQPFVIAAEMLAASTGDTHDGTALLLAETQAGTMKSPIAALSELARKDSSAEGAGGAKFDKQPESPGKVSERPKLPGVGDPTPFPFLDNPAAEEKPKEERHKPNRKKAGPAPLVIRRTAPRKSRAGFYVAILGILLLLGGGAAAYVILNQEKPADTPSPSDKNMLAAVESLAPKLPPPPSAPVEPLKRVVNGKVVPAAVAMALPAKPLSVKKQANLEDAIAKGIVFLKGQIKSTGTWKDDTGTHSVGFAALPGLALLEAGVPGDDPVIQQAAAYVRTHAPKLAETYDIGTVLLFLDLLGEAGDKKLIQSLALRLIAGQTPAGGWTYECPILSDAENAELMNFLRSNQPKVELLIPLENLAFDRRDDQPGAKPAKVTAAPKKAKLAPKATVRTATGLPKGLQTLPIVVHREKNTGFQNIGLDDNSNTHFGLLGLWAARRHDVPVELTLSLAKQRFQKTQRNDGGWGYAREQPSKNTMTCVGLLGLAMGHGAAAEVFASATAKKKLPTSMLAKDAAISDALVALGKYLDGHKELRGLEARIDLYYVWTLERVGMLYRQQKFGNTDWYGYGTKIILDEQQADGRWQIHYDAPIDTAFALLFLLRSDLVKDLTQNLHLYLAIPNATPPVRDREPEREGR